MKNLNLPIYSQIFNSFSNMKIGTTCSGIKYSRNDLVLIRFDKSVNVAGVFTKSSITSPTVGWCRNIVSTGKARALIVNSGNANTMTGKNGEIAIKKITTEISKVLACKSKEVLMSSTGVIGEDLPYQKIIDAIPKTLRQNANLNDAAKAIMTTDTYPKLASISTHIGGIPVNLVAIAKGSGMSAPNMATVLSYIFTDAKIQHNILQQLLNQTINKSLNCLTIDSDSSTNDMALFFATASSEKHKAVKSIKDSHLKDFILSLDKLMIDITKQLARDGEGASKLVIVKSKNANSKKEAKIIAKSIAESPLVKTAIFGKDPNWGRIAMAIGKTKLKVNLTKLEIKIGEFILYGKSKNQMTKKMETKVSQYLENNEEILISVDIGFDTKSANATIYSCDFTDKYISINADYRS